MEPYLGLTVVIKQHSPIVHIIFSPKFIIMAPSRRCYQTLIDAHQKCLHYLHIRLWGCYLLFTGEISEYYVIDDHTHA